MKKQIFNPLLSSQFQEIHVPEYTEKKGAGVSATLDLTWQVVTLTGASPNTICDVLMNTTSAALTPRAGVRQVGSVLDRQSTIVRTSPVIMTVKTNSLSQIEVYTSSNTTTQFFLWGEYS